MLSIRFLEWFSGLPIVGLGKDEAGVEYGRGLGGFVKNQQVIELGLMYIWVAITIIGMLFAIGTATVGQAIAGRNGYRVGFDLGFVVPMYALPGLVLHCLRYELLYAVVGRAKRRARSRGDGSWEDDVRMYQPHGVFGWWVTSHDGDFVFQGVVALVGVIIKVAAGP